MCRVVCEQRRASWGRPCRTVCSSSGIRFTTYSQTKNKSCVSHVKRMCCVNEAFQTTHAQTQIHFSKCPREFELCSPHVRIVVCWRANQTRSAERALGFQLPYPVQPLMQQALPTRRLHLYNTRSGDRKERTRRTSNVAGGTVDIHHASQVHKSYHTVGPPKV